MIVAPLIPHPANTGAGLVLEVELRRANGTLSLDYRLSGPVEGVRWPGGLAGERADGLWRTTCFEAFVQTDDGYAEFNLSPSGAWAAYRFEGYRAGMRPLETSAPRIVPRHAPGAFALTVDLDLPEGADGRMGLSAVIETLSGALSYWAMAHPSDKPDFHHPGSFVLDLSPLEGK